MSIELLRFLNGNNNGIFKAFIDKSRDDPRIAWYPSAGEDFRPLLYLSPEYTAQYPKLKIAEPLPDLFLFTDYYPWHMPLFLESPIVYKDNHTELKIKENEFLPDLKLPLDKGILDFIDRELPAYGKVVFMTIQVKSEALGTFDRHVLYVFNENEAFCSKILLPNKSKIRHVVHIQYGNGFGGGRASGAWLFGVLERLGCEVYISWEIPEVQSGDKHAFELYPNLLGRPVLLDLVWETIGKTPKEEATSETHGFTYSWYKVRQMRDV